MAYSSLSGQPGNDNYGSATIIPHTSGWISADAAYTTIGATADLDPGSCWNTLPFYNVWFTFQATGSMAKITVRTGGVYGTISMINAAIWQADGTTEVTCNIYENAADNVIVQTLNLVTGNWYYLSVDNNLFANRGTFSLLMETSVDYDYYEGAIEIPHTNGWTSADAAYTTIGGTPDKLPGDCWYTLPDYNRWFKFQAVFPNAKITVRRGGVYGTIRRINAALWQADGTTQVDCKTYVNELDNVSIQSVSLVPGNWYYVSVDNNLFSRRGTFSLLMEATVDYDYYEGAVTIPHTDGWTSANAAYTTVGATPDKLPGSCWNTLPDYNRWFKFQATGTIAKVTVRRGGVYGTIARINAALWEADGLTEIACKTYVNNLDNVYVQTSGLVPGNWYYLSVDNNLFGNRGTFSLLMETSLSYNWDGSANSDWNNPANWDSGAVPNVFVNVTIPGGVPNYPIISGELVVGVNYGGPTCRTLTINNGAQLSVVGWGQITLFNDVVINTGGSLTVERLVVGNGGKPYIFGGTVISKVFCIFAAGTGGYMNGGSFTLKNLDDNNSNWYASGGTMYIDSPSGTDAIFDITGTLSINDLEITDATKVVYTGNTNIAGNFTIQPNGKFDLTTGTINVTGNTYFEADATGMGQFIDHGTLNVTGTSTVEEYLVSERWHLVSAPIDDAQIGVYFDIYLLEYDEPTDTWNYLVLPVTIPMPVTKGYYAWADDDMTGTTTVSYTGNLNLGNDFPISSLSYTPASPAVGWNVIGNPYPAPLQWNNSWTKSNVSDWACIKNNDHEECYNAATSTGWPNAGDMADGIIPSTQGFWVRATAAGASLTIPQSERMFSDQDFYKDAAATINESLRLRVDGNNDFDVCLIQFIPGSTAGYDASYDLEKRWGDDVAPQLYAITGDDEYYSVNALPEITENMIIPLGFQVGFEAEYVITPAEFSNFKNGMTVILEDIQTNTFTELTLNSTYSFSASPLDENHRFNLHFKTSSFGTVENPELGIHVYSSEKIVYVQTPEYTIADVAIYDMMGREVAREKTHGDIISKIKLNSETGYYLVKVQTNDQFITSKVFIK